MIRRTVLSLILGLTFLSSPLHAEEKFIVVQSTTSTQNSGLFDYILPKFTAKTGIQVRVVAVGTGQAIKNAMNGDGDVLLVHARPAEEKFVADGWGVKRFDVMYNDFIIVGPPSDPAKVAGLRDAVAALKKIAASKSLFASRGDDSGTNKKEKRLWKAAQINPEKASGTWYRELGSGMGATLNAGVGMRAYVLSDRATWAKFGNKGDFKIMVEGDPRLFNQYGVMLVSAKKYPRVKSRLGQQFIDWLVGKPGQAAIGEYKLNGKQL
ncbi:MAG TPA: sulfate transporter, partial [Rhizobiales bacterium]|nr:sulfate transporter [Hyphomicrobiales bacterium]